MSNALTNTSLENKYSRGFQLLKKNGWQPNQGLGKHGTGILTPIEVLRVNGEINTFIRDNNTNACSILRELSNDEVEIGSNVGNNAVKFLPHIFIEIDSCILYTLIDTGCEISCINLNTYEQLKGRTHIPILPIKSTKLCVATGNTQVKVNTQIWLEFKFQSVDRKNFGHSFLVVKHLIRPIILGIDWLYDVEGIVDFPNCQLVLSYESERINVPFQISDKCVTLPSDVVQNFTLSNCKNSQSIRATPAKDESGSFYDFKQKINEVSVGTNCDRERLYELLCEYKDLFSPNPGLTNKYTHVIQLHDYTPFVRKTYPIPFSLRDAVDAEINRMLALGVIKREPTSYISPILVVKKKNGSVRLCLDARWINAKMLNDCETPLPAEEILNSLHNVAYISLIDLVQSYWQIPLDVNSTQYTGFLYNGKSYTFQRLPFGLKTAVGSFSRAIDIILGPEVREYVYNYIDDILVVSSTYDEHLHHLRTVFERLRQAGLTVSFEKTELLKSEVKFLGYVLTSKGIFTDEEKTECIQNFPRPNNVKQLRGFLGLCNFYRRFVQNYSSETVPLTKLLSKNTRWRWTTEHELAFNTIKKLFLQTVMISFPDFTIPFYLQTDGSGFALGVECYQLDEEGEHHVIGFASRKLQGPELLYTVTEKELLGIVFGLKKFQTLIMGRQIIIRTDHYALKFLKQCRLLNDRLTRWVLFLNQFEYTIEHVKGRENVVADTLSRYAQIEEDPAPPSPVVAPTPLISSIICLLEVGDYRPIPKVFKNLKGSILRDSTYGPLYNSLLGKNVELDVRKSHLKAHMILYNGLLCYKSETDENFRLVLTKEIMYEVIKTTHEYFGHCGAVKLQKILQPLVYTVRMGRVIRKFVRSCDLCQRTKYTNRYLEGSTNPIIYTQPGELVTCDYFGPLPEGRGKATQIFVVIDCFTKFVKLYPLRRAQAKISVNKILYDFCKIIPVKAILSDHGSQFTSKYWQETLRAHNIKVFTSSIRHPASNPSERVMRELGRLLRAYVGESHSGWAHVVPKIEELFNSVPHLSTGFSPYQLLYGENLSVRFENNLLKLLPPRKKMSLAEMRERAVENLRKAASDRGKYNKEGDCLSVGDFVLLRENPLSDASKKIMHKLCPLYSGPYEIINRPHPNVYTICDPETKTVKGNFNITNLRLYYKREN